MEFKTSLFQQEEAKIGESPSIPFLQALSIPFLQALPKVMCLLNEAAAPSKEQSAE